MPAKKPTKKSPKKTGRQAPRAEIGILGGTGLYEIEGIADVREVKLRTPMGAPSDAYIVGTLEGRRVAFLSRHSRGHRLLPQDINYRANIYGFKMLGVEKIISVSSCGSLKEEIRPRDIVFADQFYDRTRRVNTFFGGGIAAHVGLAQPVCAATWPSSCYETAVCLGRPGPFRRDLYLHRGAGLLDQGRIRDLPLLGLLRDRHDRRHRGQALPRGRNLLRDHEPGTDYDVWHAEEEDVSVELVLENLRLNIHNAKAIIKKAVATLPPRRRGGVRLQRGAPEHDHHRAELSSPPRRRGSWP